jgi:nitrate/TMAO reductase-like tetraheme cytochrome c subunit
VADEEGGAPASRLWSGRRWLLGLPAGGVLMLVFGAVGLAAANAAIHTTSRSEFCFGCHSHEVNIRAEWEASSHFRNASGVRAECADCHLPQDDWLDLVLTKIVVSADIVPELMGKLDTPEKYEAHRREMAEAVWAEYREDDSRYCRSCHLPGAMLPEAQSPMARAVHGRMAETGATCIDCHKGLVHALPEGS